jgi:mycothiol synthase
VTVSESIAPLAERAAAPASLPVPTAGGLAWRAAVPADAPALLELQNAILAAEGAPYRLSLAEVEESFGSPMRDDAADTLVGIDADGVPRAFGSVGAPPGDTTLVRTYLEGGVHPNRQGEGIGRELLAWQVARARQVLAGSGKDAPARIMGFAEDDAPESRHHLFTRAGFDALRFYHELLRDLRPGTPPVPDVALDGSLRLVPWSAALDEPTRLAHNDAFRDHWGSQPQSPEQWLHGRSEFAPEWSFVVVDDAPDVDAVLADTDAETAAALRDGAPLVVGYQLAAKYAEDFPVRGFTFGYTDILGVRRTYRGRGIGVAALAAGMRAFAADGMEFASLGVDTANPSGAYGLYARLGYEKDTGSRLYAIDL